MQNGGKKETTSVEKQIFHLKSRKLIIEDELKAQRFLQKNNLYKVKGYFSPFRNKKIFSEKITFQHIIDAYEFDRLLRFVILKYTEIIEVSFKTVYSNVFAKIHSDSASAYLQEEFFNDTLVHQNIIKCINYSMGKYDKTEDSATTEDDDVQDLWKSDDEFEQQAKNTEAEEFVRHYHKKREDLPIWAAVHIISFGKMSSLYYISEEKVKSEVAEEFHFYNGKKIKQVASIIRTISVLRNLCAHNSRLFDRIFITKASLNNEEENIIRKYNDGKYNNDYLFGHLIMFRRFLDKEDFISLIDDIIKIHDVYPGVDMKYYGFPENWVDALLEASEIKIPEPPKDKNNKYNKIAAHI